MEAIRLTANGSSLWQQCQAQGRFVRLGLLAFLLVSTSAAVRAAEPLAPVSEHETDDAGLPNGLTLSSLTARARRATLVSARRWPRSTSSEVVPIRRCSIQIRR